LTNIKFMQEAATFDLLSEDKLVLKASHGQISEPQLYSICAACALALEFGLEANEIDKGIAEIRPVSGRLQHLKGINNSTLIDDTYNASPEATRAALEMLYRYQAPQKIALLGNMNELGKYSEVEHAKIGKFCDAEQLDWVITLGPDANKYLAPAAQAKGCQVKTFDTPYEAGEFIKSVVKNKAIVLLKGSQNRVFAEETVKKLLANPADSNKLVRQTPEWQKIKNKAFG
jgi:UDP-N-acetylmuramoyl-tripeptide--D-alanyl-D-alanine ligase